MVSSMQPSSLFRQGLSRARGAVPLGALLLALVVTHGCNTTRQELETFHSSGRVEPGAFPDVDAVVLLDRSELTFTYSADKQRHYAELFRTLRVQVLTPKGVERAKVQIPFDNRSRLLHIQARRIQPDGTITGVFTNGVSQPLGQIAVATFNAADQLERQGGNKFTVTGTSGKPNIGVAGTGGRGFVVGGALEQSNVDVGDELVRMIIAQRSFQANSKIVSTADTLLG